MGSVRFLTNANINVENGNITSKEFVGFGSIYDVDKVVNLGDGYCDVYFANGKVVREISEKAFSTMGKVNVEWEEKKVEEEPVAANPVDSIVSGDNITIEETEKEEIEGTENVETTNDGGSSEEPTLG